MLQQSPVRIWVIFVYGEGRAYCVYIHKLYTMRLYAQSLGEHTIVTAGTGGVQQVTIILYEHTYLQLFKYGRRQKTCLNQISFLGTQ